MNYFRWILILTTFAIAAVFSFWVYIWSQDFKDQFLYNNDIIGYIMVFVFVIALTGILKWFLKEEIILTDPKRKIRRPRR